MASRILIHCDLDAFFAAVETLHHNLDPDVPLILGSDPKMVRGGIVSTCNYAARNMEFAQQCRLEKHGGDARAPTWAGII